MRLRFCFVRRPCVQLVFVVCHSSEWPCLVAHNLLWPDSHGTRNRRPMYCSENYAGDYAVAEGMQRSFEDLLYKHKVDLALWGHYHSYERCVFVVCSVILPSIAERVGVFVFVKLCPASAHRPMFSDSASCSARVPCTRTSVFLARPCTSSSEWPALVSCLSLLCCFVFLFVAVSLIVVECVVLTQIWTTRATSQSSGQCTMIRCSATRR